MKIMAEEIHKIVSEVQTSNRFILRRLNHIVSGNTPGQCCCARNELVAGDFSGIEAKIKDLENNDQHIQDTIAMACNVFENITSESNGIKQENKTANNVNGDKAKATENTININATDLESNKERTFETSLGSVKLDTQKDNHSGAKTDSSNTKTSFRPDQRATIIQRPNFIRDTTVMNRNASSIRTIDSKVKASHPDSNYWGFLATMEHSDAEKQLKDLDGAHTVICVDISSSMADGNAWTQASTFVNDYIEGLEHVQKEHGLHDDHLALVTFGHDTRVVQRLTNDVTKIRNAFGGISIGGPSPMYAGMIMTFAAGASSDKTIYQVNNHIVTTKIILISDMNPTDTCMYQGPDVADPGQLDETKTHVISKMQEIQTADALDIFFVPVGNFDKEFLDLMQVVSEGKKLHFKQGRHFSRRLYLTNLAPDPLGIINPRGDPKWSGSDKARLSEDDMKQLEDIKAEGMKHMLRRLGEEIPHENELKDTDSDTLPHVGVRVRRGPDWRWNDQDNYGPGTVVGHSEGGKQVWVNWDNNEKTGAFQYRYSGNYDVLIANEPRTVTDGKIAVGCTVKPGKDFPYANTKIKQHDRGIAIRLSKGNRTVNVKWNNKEKGEYKFASSQKDTAEVELETFMSTSVLHDTLAKEQ